MIQKKNFEFLLGLDLFPNNLWQYIYNSTYVYIIISEGGDKRIDFTICFFFTL